MNPAQTPQPLPAARRSVVLLHSSASSSRQWDLLAEALRPTHEVHAIDLYGHGRRPAWAGPRALSVHDDARLALEVLERAGGGHLVGHSYGGAVALHLAAARPELVHSLAVYEPVVFSLLAERAPASPALLEVFAIAKRLKHLVARGLLAEGGETFIDYWSGPGTWRAMPADRQRSIAMRMPPTADQFDTLIGEPLSATALARLRRPTLVMHGTQTTASAHLLVQLLRELLPGARYEPMPGLGHMGPLTHPQRVNECLLRFLQGATANVPSVADAVA